MPHPLALVDLTQADSHPTHPSRLTRAALTALHDIGFLALVGHGIPQPLIDRVHAASRAFFALPDPTKSRYHLPGLAGQRGYTPFGVERAKDQDTPDRKEFWQVGVEDPAPGFGLDPNVWPEEVSDFRPAALALFDHLSRVGRTLLRAIAPGLDLPADWFEDKLEHGDSILRLIHYPPVPPGAPGVRSAQHEDIDVLTLLVGSHQPGLEVLRRDGTWVPITSLPGTLVCNVGDMLQRLTCGHLPSTTHRVVNPPGAAAQVARFSAPFFLHFRHDVPLTPLPSCIDPHHPERTPAPTTAGEYLRERLREIGLA